MQIFLQIYFYACLTLSFFLLYRWNEKDVFLFYRFILYTQRRWRDDAWCRIDQYNTV